MNESSDKLFDKTLPSMAATRISIGDVIANRYQVLSALGSGGMGTVYKVLDTEKVEIQALKILSIEGLGDPILFQRFQQEAKACSVLSHPCLVDWRDFGILPNGLPYFSMEYVQGESLADRIKRSGALTIEEVKRISLQVCSGLKEAHKHGIVHRDLKPSNIMIASGASKDEPGGVKIVDFGIAKVSEDQSAHLTQTGEILGSPLYMSPEQCRGQQVDHRSDIYSLGCVLFEALTATPPHIGSSPVQTMMLHEQGPAPSLKEASLSKTFPAVLERTIAKTLAKAPIDRYQTIEELEADLIKIGADADAIEPLIDIDNTAPTDTTAEKLSPKTIVIWLGLGLGMIITALVILNNVRF